jgi:hypothetical protein
MARLRPACSNNGIVRHSMIDVDVASVVGKKDRWLVTVHERFHVLNHIQQIHAIHPIVRQHQ